MKKIQILIFSCFLFPFLMMAADVFFVPGWRTGFDKRTGCVHILGDIFPDKTISVKSWDSRQSWKIAKRNASFYRKELLSEILSMPESSRRELILIGHSIGAKIVAEILDELADRELRIHSAVFLGAAFVEDDFDIEKLLSVPRFYCCNIYNPDDWILKYLFPMDEFGKKALGEKGLNKKNNRIIESQCSDNDFIFLNHFAYLYLLELQKLLNEIEPWHKIEILNEDIEKRRIPADNIFWEDKDSFFGWRFQKYVRDEKFRIIDPEGFRRASGDFNKINKIFTDIHRQYRKMH